MASATAFTILGTIGLDNKQAEAAMAQFTASTKQMSDTVTAMAAAAGKAFAKAEAGADAMHVTMKEIAEATKATAASTEKFLKTTKQGTDGAGDGAKKATGEFIKLRDVVRAIAVSALLQQMKSFTDQMISAATQTQGFRRALTAVTGSGAEAEKVLKDIAAYAERTPFENANLTEIATKFASMRQPIMENVDLAAKLAFIFKKDLANSGDIVAQANAGVIDSLVRLKEQFGFTVTEAQKYGAIVADGHIVLGEKGSAANDRFMASLRGFIADREKGLGGNIFGGSKGLGEAISNIGDSSFQLFSQLGEAATPTVVAFSGHIQTLIKWFRELSPTMQSLIAHVGLLSSAIVIGGTLLGPFIGTLVSLAGSASTAGAALLAMNPATLALTGLVVAGSVALVAYNSHLDQLNKNLQEAAKSQVELHKTTANTQQRMERLSGQSISSLTPEGVAKAGLSTEDNLGLSARLTKEAAAFRDNARRAKEDYYRSPEAQTKESQKEFNDYLDRMEQQAKAREASAWAIQKVELEKAVAATKASLMDFVDGVRGVSKKLKDPQTIEQPRAREFHEILSDYQRESELRNINMGLSTPDYAKKLASLEKESQQSLKDSQLAKLKDYFSSEVKLGDKSGAAAKDVLESGGDISAVGKRYNLTDAQTKFAASVYEGKMNNPDQIKALVAVNKELIGVRKDLLELDIANLQSAEKLADIQHKSTPASRIAEIQAEAAAVKSAADARTISADDASKRLRALHIEAEKERQSQLDAQRDVNIELKSLYGDDVTSKGLALQKKLTALREAGVSETQITRITAAEKQRIYNDDAQNAISAAQRVADARSTLDSKKRATRESTLSERIHRGDTGAVDELVRTQGEQLEADLRKVDADAKRRRRSIEVDLKDPSLSKHERAALTEELRTLTSGEAQRAEKDRLTQEAGAKQRQALLDKEKVESADKQASAEAEKLRLGMKQADVMEKYRAGAIDQTTATQYTLAALREQLSLQKQILEAKYAVLIAEKSGNPAAQAALQKQLKLETLEAERGAVEAAKQATSEIDKQAESQRNLNNLKRSADPRYSAGDSQLGSSINFSGFSNFGEGFGKSIYKDTPINYASKLGIDPGGRKTTLDALAATGLAKASGSGLGGSRPGYSASGAKRSDLSVTGDMTVRVEVVQGGQKVGEGVAKTPLSRQASESNSNAPLGGR